MFKVFSSISSEGRDADEAPEAMRKKQSAKGFNLSNNEMESQFLADFGFSLSKMQLV